MGKVKVTITDHGRGAFPKEAYKVQIFGGQLLTTKPKSWGGKGV